MDFEDFLYGPSKTHTANPIGHPTAFPTVLPDPTVYQGHHVTGQRTLWVTFVLLVLASIGFAASGWVVPASKRLLHSLTTLAVVISAISYFAYATGGGTVWSFRYVQHKHKGDIPDTYQRAYREIYWARYIEWGITFSLIVSDLIILAGSNGASLFSAVSGTLIFTWSGLFTVFSWRKISRWGWFTISVLSLVWVLYVLLVSGISTSRARGVSTSRFYSSLAIYTAVVILVYPIIHILGPVTRYLSVDGEIIAYAVLDILSKIVFGGWLLLTNSRLADNTIHVGGFWSLGHSEEGAIRVGDDDEAA